MSIKSIPFENISSSNGIVDFTLSIMAVIKVNCIQLLTVFIAYLYAYCIPV